MSDILVSIIESIADAAAAARARRGEEAAVLPSALPSRQAPPAAQAAPVIPVIHRAKPRVEPPPVQPAERRIEPRRLFADPQSLIRTVVATEILGPPLALRRQNLWDPPGV
ncbi:MAG TPA: hypothetical protein VGG22_05460 [Candidatus Baltobacteraceae bacterium]